MSEQQKNGKMGKGGKIAFAVCLVVIVALLGVVIFLLFRGQDEEEPKRRSVVVNEDNVDEVLESLEEGYVPPGYYEVTMNSTWNFESGDAPSTNAYVENTQTNANPVYFDVVREDTGETIYESPIIPVGSHLNEIVLDTALDAGTYDCILTYHLLDEEEQDISTLQLTVQIVVGQ